MKDSLSLDHGATIDHEKLARIRAQRQSTRPTRSSFTQTAAFFGVLLLIPACCGCSFIDGFLIRRRSVSMDGRLLSLVRGKESIAYDMTIASIAPTKQPRLLGARSFAACLMKSHSTIDQASLSRRSIVPTTPKRDLQHLDLMTFFTPIYYIQTFSSCIFSPSSVSPSVATICLLG